MKLNKKRKLKVLIMFCMTFTANLRHCAVTACLVPLCSVYGLAITTIEGIGSTKTKLHPLQVCNIKLNLTMKMTKSINIL